MSQIDRIQEQFQKLLEIGRVLLDNFTEASLKKDAGLFREAEYKAPKWMIRGKHLIVAVCGEASVHAKELVAYQTHSMESAVRLVYEVLSAAADDYADGMLKNIRHLVRADVAADFLEQAEALLRAGYAVPAASLAGAVLEDTLRKLCDANDITYDPKRSTIEALNVALAKADVYDKLVQKEITAKADLRNTADHGRFNEVKAQDVENMLRWVRSFVADRLP